jgi:two-component system NtrC family sensor kinase
MEMQAGWALVIDADVSAHALYRQALGDLGYDVDICDRGASASLALMRRAYDVILLNPRTPSICGIEILRQSHRQRLPVPLVVIAGQAPTEPELSDTDAAETELLYQPLTLERIQHSVERAVRQPAPLVVPPAAAGVTFYGDHELDTLYRQIVRILMVRFEADRASLMLWSGDSDQIDVAASAGFPFSIPGTTNAPLHDSVSGWVIRHGEPLLLEPDGELPFDLQSTWRNNAIRSGICAPLVVRGQVLGLLALARRTGRAPFATAELDFLVSLASQVATMLDQARASAQTQYRLQLLGRLNALGTELMAAGDLDTILRATVDQIADQFPQIRGYLFLRESHSPWIDRVATVGAAKLVSPSLDDLRDQPGLAGQVLADGVPRLRRAVDLPHTLATWEQQLLGTGDQLLCVALKTNASVYGAIELAGWPPATDEEDVQFMIALAAQVALAVERAQLYATTAHAAARYDAMFEHAADAILLLDRARNAIVAANPAAERMSGYSQLELAQIAPARLIAPAMIGGRATVPVADLLAGTVSAYEGYIRTRSGFSVPVSIAANAVADQASGYLLLAVRNMSEAQRQAQQLAQHEKIAGMTRLTESIAHEINNPLQALHNTLHLLINRPFTEDKRERLLSMAQMEVDRLTVIVRRMLELHRPTSADMRLVSVHSLLEGALTSVAAQLQQHHVVIERRWADRLPWVNGIGGHLKQVFQDLVLNAAEAMPDGGRLLVSTRVEESQGGPMPTRVLVEFADTGPGISESEAQLIFEPFYTTKRANTGLGLAISYSIVERHGGSLTVISGSSGTTFRVALPAVHS